jgi:hypothetical protein
MSQEYLVRRDLGASAQHGGCRTRDHSRTECHRFEKGYGRDLLYRSGDSHYVLLRYWNSEQARRAALEDPDLLRCWARLGNEIQILKVYEKLEESASVRRDPCGERPSGSSRASPHVGEARESCLRNHHDRPIPVRRFLPMSPRTRSCADCCIARLTQRQRTCSDSRRGIELPGSSAGCVGGTLLPRPASLVLRCDLPYRQDRPYGPPAPGDAKRDRAGLKNAVAASRI